MRRGAERGVECASGHLMSCKVRKLACFVVH